MAAMKLVKDAVAKNAFVVFSKTTCPYCNMVKSISKELEAEAKFIELNTRNDGSLIQDALQEMTGSRTVPKVFIGGSFIGGADDTRELYENGQLVEILANAGIKMAKSSSFRKPQEDAL